MSAATLLLLVCSWQPGDHPPGFPYPQMPSEAVCDLCVKQCEADVAAITARLELIGGRCYDVWGGASVGTAGGGWQAEQLRDLLREAYRRKNLWYAAHWVTWSRANAEQRDEWANILAGQITSDEFWRGDLPLPLSLGARR